MGSWREKLRRRLRPRGSARGATAGCNRIVTTAPTYVARIDGGARGNPGPAGWGVVIQTPDGTVVPGSPKTVKSIGESQIASALEAAALSMSFDFDAGAKPAMPIAFTTTFAACRS